MIFKTTHLVAGALIAALGIHSASAAWISGEVDFAGSSTLNGTPLTATAFNGFSGGVVTAGATDSYTGTDGSLVNLTGFAFGTLGPVATPFVAWNFSYGGKLYNFTLKSIDAVTRTTTGNGHLDVDVSGIAHIDGFQDTPATFSIETSGKKTSVSFSSSTTAVPEPGTFAVVAGLGLVGFGVWRRR
jgi:MYXO-CTERM domain-containing protein